MHFSITGHIKPYVRMTQKSLFVDPQAKEYLVSKNDIRDQLSRQFDHAIFDRQSLRVTGLVIVKNRKGDLDNIIKAILDAMQGIVFVNDCWVDDIRFIRKIDKTQDELANIQVEVL